MELEGKSIAFLGDSITEGAGISEISNRYDNRLKKMLNLSEVYNYGISGTRLAHQSKPSEDPRQDLCFCGRAYDIKKDVDVVIVYGGVNDYLHGDAPFGKNTDQTPATFCGAVNFLMNYLCTEHPNARIVFLTPAHEFFEGLSDAFVSTSSRKRFDAKPLIDYVQAIEQAGKFHSIPVLNLFEKLKINPNNTSDWTKYTVDGLHFNDCGHEILAHCISAFLKSLT